MAKQQHKRRVMFQFVVVAVAAVVTTIMGGDDVQASFVVVPPPLTTATVASQYYSVQQQQQQQQQDRIILASTRTALSLTRRIHHHFQLHSSVQPLSPLFMSSSSTQETEEMGPSLSEQKQEEVEFTLQEVKIIEELYSKAIREEEESSNNSPERIQQCITDALPNLAPKLVLKLRQAADSNNNNIAIRRIAMEMNQLLEFRMTNAKETLQRLLQAGEIRKLDNLIGQAAKNGQLDVAFFNVLSFNLKDAAASSSQQQQQQQQVIENENKKEEKDAAASRLQILQHIYTRCQEEVEKSIPPGSTLLNKLLRTKEDSIRANLYRHYLTIPETNTIVTPDGKTIEIKSPTKSLVSINEFCNAIALTVQQIRTVQQANAVDKESAANMVETCRQIAKEARGILGQAYGVDSIELQTLETNLQPVFRPTSSDSPYIKGTD